LTCLKKTTGECELEEPIDEKKKAAQESGRRGGLKGGKTRATCQGHHRCLAAGIQRGTSQKIVGWIDTFRLRQDTRS